MVTGETPLHVLTSPQCPGNTYMGHTPTPMCRSGACPGGVASAGWLAVSWAVGGVELPIGMSRSAPTARRRHGHVIRYH